MAKTPSPPRSSRSAFEHPDRARMISSSRSRSPRQHSRSPERRAREYYRLRQSSRDSHQGRELPMSPPPPRAMTGTNNTPLVPRGARVPSSIRPSEGASSSQMIGTSYIVPTSKAFAGSSSSAAASSSTTLPPNPAQTTAEKKKQRLKEYLKGPPDPPADVVAWTGVSARNQKHGANFYTGAYAIVWEKGEYRNEVQSFFGPGKSNVYAEFKAVSEVLKICRSTDRVLVKTTSSEVINAIEYGMNTDFWEEVANIRGALRKLVKNRVGRVIFKKVPSRVGLPYNDRACAMADQARKHLESSGTATKKPKSTAPRELSPVIRPEMPEVPRKMPMSEEKAQEFLEDFQAFLRAKALASLHTSADVDEDGHRTKSRKLSHPSQRDPRITGGQVTPSPPKQDAISPRQVPGGVQEIIRPEQSAAVAPRLLSVVERSNDPAQQQQEESDDEFFDAIDYWVDPTVEQMVDKADDEKPKAASTLSWISNLADE